MSTSTPAALHVAPFHGKKYGMFDGSAEARARGCREVMPFIQRRRFSTLRRRNVCHIANTSVRAMSASGALRQQI